MLDSASTEGSSARPRNCATLLGIALLVLFALACGSGSPRSLESADYTPALEAAPPKLAALYSKPAIGALSGEDDYASTLAALEGTPVVVNDWASWCLPCREEFPLFQAQAAERLDRVAFLGVNSEDSTDAASTFLRDYPVPYPSIADPDGQIQKWIARPLRGLPNTFFYDRAGGLTYVKQGPYTDEAALAADIERYAVGR